MKLSRNLLLLISTMLFITSCSKIIYISKSIDPEIPLDKEHHNIVFVNLFDYTSSDNVKDQEKMSFHHGVMGLLEGLSSITNDSLFSFAVDDTLKKGIDNGLLTTLFPEDSISAICSRNRSDLLLTLDSLSVFFDWEVDEGYDENGKVERTKNFYIHTNFFISLYSSAGELINRSEVDQSNLYRSRPTFLYGAITLKPSLAKAKGVVGNMAFQAGQDYIAKFYPQINQDVKQLYTGKLFRESNDLIFARNWNKAIELLTQLASNQDPEVAKKAIHNLEVAKEASEASKR